MSPGPSSQDQVTRFEVDRLIKSAQAALSRGNGAAAVDQFLRAVRLMPTNAALLATLGELYQHLMHPADAEAAFHDALRLSDTEPRALAGLASIYLNANRPNEAVEYAKRALKVMPGNSYIRLVLARALSDIGRFSEADAEIDRVLKDNPSDPVALYTRGGRYRESGKFPEARREFLNAIDVSPGYAAAYWGYVQCGRMTEADREFVTRIEKALAGNVLDRKGRIEVLFSLGKAHDDLREYEQAMTAFREANKMRDQDLTATRAFPKAEFAQLNDLTMSILDEKAIRESRVEDTPTPCPIFIVGMFRSGTTLVEQIVSSHPSVAAGGEIRFWVDEFIRCMDFRGGKLDQDRAIAAREAYLARLAELGKGAPFVTDKMPDNYKVLGLIGAMFPNAKIIHCSRHPVDTCLSIYFTPFFTAPPFAADPEKLVFTYELYRKLMDHWHQVLPKGSILDVRYSELIQGPESVTRRIIQFCGLTWDDACLHPETTERAVGTASAWQVRQPIYKTSSERWRNYEPWLDGFRPLLSLADPT